MDYGYIENLVSERTQVYAQEGHDLEEAQKMALDDVQEAAKAVIERGLDKRPDNYGDILLREQSTNASVKAAMDKPKAEGATDEDIRWWWNMPPIEQMIIEKDDGFIRIAAFIGFREQGMDPPDAARRVSKIHPKFGASDDDPSPDRPLPIELKRRIVDYLEKSQRNPARLLQLLEEHSSFNALVRHEIALGNL